MAHGVDPQRDTLIRTVWGEARGEIEEGRKAVAHTVRNRVNDSQRRYGNTIQEVCMRPHQYACWNPTDVNYDPMRNLSIHHREYQEIAEQVDQVLHGLHPDNTNGSKHYHTSTTQHLHPWAQGKEPTRRIGNHWFYNDIDP